MAMMGKGGGRMSSGSSPRSGGSMAPKSSPRAMSSMAPSKSMRPRSSEDGKLSQMVARGNRAAANSDAPKMMAPKGPSRMMSAGVTPKGPSRTTSAGVTPDSSPRKMSAGMAYKSSPRAMSSMAPSKSMRPRSSEEGKFSQMVARGNRAAANSDAPKMMAPRSPQGMMGKSASKMAPGSSPRPMPRAMTGAFGAAAKMAKGGKCRGMGAAIKSGKFVRAG